eukprot:365806-Chlamydomonas_euryale.AAC.23
MWYHTRQLSWQSQRQGPYLSRECRRDATQERPGKRLRRTGACMRPQSATHYCTFPHSAIPGEMQVLPASLARILYRNQKLTCEVACQKNNEKCKVNADVPEAESGQKVRDLALQQRRDNMKPMPNVISFKLPVSSSVPCDSAQPAA